MIFIFIEVDIDSLRFVSNVYYIGLKLCMIDITFNNNSVIQYIITVSFIGEEKTEKMMEINRKFEYLRKNNSPLESN